MVAKSTSAAVPLKSELHASIIAVIVYHKQTMKQSRPLHTFTDSSFSFSHVSAESFGLKKTSKYNMISVSELNKDIMYCV